MNKAQKLALYDRAIPPLLKQGRVSVYPDSFDCAYRAPNLRCAVGFLISNEHYRSDLEGHTAGDHCIIDAVINSNPDLNLHLSDYQELGDFLQAFREMEIPA